MTRSAPVSIVRCESYKLEALGPAIAEACKLIACEDLETYVGKRVLLKVNLLNGANPDASANTHIEFSRGVIRYLKSRGLTPVVSDSSGPFEDTMGCFARSGYAAMCKEEGTSILPLSQNGYVRIEIPDGRQIRSVLASRLFLDADLVISLPKVKTHVQTVFTGGVKNFFAVLPLAERRRFHRLSKYEAFSESIVDLYSAVGRGIALMDGIVGMQGNGPSSGSPKELGLVLASRNAANLDVVACSVIGLSRNRVHTVKDTIERGMAAPIENIEVLGPAPSEVARRFDIPVRLLLRANPIIEKLTDIVLGLHASALEVKTAKCTACGHCRDICPVGAIVIDKHCRIDYSECIKCYCCFEVCPYGAIQRKQPFGGRILRRLRAAVQRG
ncbi:MAG: DUF362 domain-containing protein [Candidatus Coatesbacteria bacterium]|nr:DUF362 domain-containing protein [Candidatus Coatesbacteria bacterium]